MNSFKRQFFNEAGIVVVRYASGEDAWKTALSREINAASNSSLFDFVIICVLEKERTAFQYCDATVGEFRRIRGLDCIDIQIGDQRGVIIRPPRMGMTDAAIITTRAIDEFKPKVVAMSGICAGIPGETEIGDVIVAENCFDYQVGKWTKAGFEFEIYQTSIQEEIRGVITQIIASDPMGTAVRKGLDAKELDDKKIKLVTHASGSAVVSDKKRRQEIVEQHRKRASVEMEIFSVYRAATLSPHSPIFFAIKGVVDNAGASKGDKYHVYGATVSARLLVKCLSALLN